MDGINNVLFQAIMRISLISYPLIKYKMIICNKSRFILCEGFLSSILLTISIAAGEMFFHYAALNLILAFLFFQKIYLTHLPGNGLLLLNLK